ncbi:MAG: PVC-type heme-binding CxxCH protein [Verrucomicrobiales bacterium]
MKIPRCTLAALPVVVLAAGPGWSAPLLTPQEAVKKMQVPEGFQVDLLAAEPDLVQPIAMCFDARGRIWVVEGNTYPRRATKPPERADGDGDLSKPNAAQKADIFGGHDRILIFEDGDGDGSFERRKVFIEGLNLVSGIEVGFGGVYVGAAPYLLHIPLDPATDKPAGDPVILADGWGYQDTHETLNSFIWGPDGWLYGCHGVFTHSEVRVCARPPGAPPAEGTSKRTPLNCAYWRYHPAKHTFEIFAHGTSNSWGFDYNEFGDWFSTACVIPHFWHIIQGGYYLRQSNPLGHFNPYVYTNIETIADHQHFIGTTPHSGNNVSDEAGGGHAHCGLLIYNGDNFPPEYRGRAMFFNIHGQRINQENLVPHGSGHIAKHLPDFLKTHDPNFTGVALKVGPDGAIYFIDWYDQQKCHRNEPEIWDRSNGRLYRVKFASTWKPWKGDLTKRTVPELLAEQKSNNGWNVRHSRQVLHQHVWADSANSTQAISGRALYENWETTDSEQSVQRDLGALWIDSLVAGKNPEIVKDQIFGRLDASVARSDGPWANVVATAVTVSANLHIHGDKSLGFWRGSRGPQPIAVTAQYLVLANRGGPTVRLAVASALQRLPVDQRWEIAEALLQHAEDAEDHNLPQMYWYGIEPCVPTNPERALELAANSKIPLVARHIARRVADMGNDEALASLLKAMAKEKTGAGIAHLAKAALDGLRGRTGLTAPKEWEGAYANFDQLIARRPDAQERAGELRDLRTALAVAFGDQRVFPQLRTQVADTALAVERRQVALQTLATGRDPELGGLLVMLLDDPALRLSAIRNVGLQSTSDGDTTATALLSRYADFSAEEKSAAINALATRPAWASALLGAVQSGAIERSAVPSFVARQIADFKDEALTAKLEEAWGKVGGAALGPEMEKMAAEEHAKWKKVLTPDFLKGADRSAGRVLYATSCGQCHILFGEGGKIGPDLTGSNRANLDYILENVTNPNALIGADYELHIFSLKDGRGVAGMVRKETDTAFTVQTITSEEIVAKADIAEHSKPGFSMMAMNLFTALSNEQVRDLVAYLTSPTQVPLPGEGPVDTVMRVPGAIEGESMKVIAKSAGEAAPQNMAGFPDSRWSGDDQLWWTGAKAGDRLTLALPVTQPGKYAIKAVFSRAPDYGVAKFHLNGRPLGDKQVDFFGWKVTATPLLTLGEAELTAGEHPFTIEITGANPEAVKAFMVGLDYLWLEKL